MFLSRVIDRQVTSAASLSLRRISTLVTAKWLNDNLKNTKVLDGSWYMPSAKRDTHQEFLTKRIPTAQFFGIDEICDKSNPLPHMLPTPDHFSDAIGSLGISNKDHVVVYDTKGIFSACRVYYTFKVFGHTKVSILSGGLPDWIAEGYPTVSGPVETHAKVKFESKFNPALVQNLAGILQNIEKQKNGEGITVVDARSEGRFNGKEPEPRLGLPSGSIPFSLNVPFQMVLDNEGRHFRTTEKIAEVFSAKGVDITKPTIVSCGSGLTAAILFVALELCGNDRLAIYDGSWTEYATEVLLKNKPSP